MVWSRYEEWGGSRVLESVPNGGGGEEKKVKSGEKLEGLCRGGYVGKGKNEEQLLLTNKGQAEEEFVWRLKVWTPKQNNKK